MSLCEDIKRYLPQYLSQEAQSKLFAELGSFPENIEKRLYSNIEVDDDFVYQGDGLQKLLIVELPSKEFREGPAMVLSNTCDVSFENERKFLSPNIIYCPLIKFRKYLDWLREKRELLTGEALESHAKAIQQQHISTFFYVPAGAKLTEDYIALLDRLNNCDLQYLNSEVIRATRVFSLSNYGLYLFLLKISIHFTRITEGVDRG
jgi:hypothetical protein